MMRLKRSCQLNRRYSIVSSDYNSSSKAVVAALVVSSSKQQQQQRPVVDHTYQDHYHDEICHDYDTIIHPQQSLMKTDTCQVSTNGSRSRSSSCISNEDDNMVCQEQVLSSSSSCAMMHIPRPVRGGVMVAFPERLHEMLHGVDDDGLGYIVSWQSHGRCFIIRDKALFLEKIIGRFFHQTKLTSFQRQLNLYGFNRLTAGIDRGAYYHELFLRGRIDLCRRMIRTRIKGNGMKAVSSPNTEPNFYQMKPCCLVSTPSKRNKSQMIISADNKLPIDNKNKSKTSILTTANTNHNKLIPNNRMAPKLKEETVIEAKKISSRKIKSDIHRHAIVSPIRSSSKIVVDTNHQWSNNSVKIIPMLPDIDGSIITDIDNKTNDEDESSSMKTSSSASTTRGGGNYHLNTTTTEISQQQCGGVLLLPSLIENNSSDCECSITIDTSTDDDHHHQYDEYDDYDDDDELPETGDEVYFEGHKFRYLDHINNVQDIITTSSLATKWKPDDNIMIESNIFINECNALELLYYSEI